MLKYICTEVTFSPDKWEKVILRFDVIKRDKNTDKEIVLRIEEVAMPFYTYKTIKDKKTGEERTRKSGCMSAGDFTNAFRHAITCKALATFYPGELTHVLRMTDIALKICGTRQLVNLPSMAEFFSEAEKFVTALEAAKKKNQKANGAPALKTAYAWICLRSIVEVFDAFTRSATIPDDDEEDNDNDE